MALRLYKNSPTRGRWRGAYYEKGNLEIHSSDAGGDTDRYCDYTRCDLLFRRIKTSPTPNPNPSPVMGKGAEGGGGMVERRRCDI